MPFPPQLHHSEIPLPSTEGTNNGHAQGPCKNWGDSVSDLGVLGHVDSPAKVRGCPFPEENVVVVKGLKAGHFPDGEYSVALKVNVVIGQR
jgi:hypothetical protein